MIRKFKIAVGNNRKSLNWKTTEMLWSEFGEKIKNPQRTTETLEEFLKLPKAKQDELKDVGGFVGGELIGSRRKNSNVKSRDLITLDLDNINTGKTNDVLKSVGALGCSYVVYSTRKHAEYAPRLRVIVPLDKPCTPDEYEPIARKIAQLIGIQMADPTTFEVSRMMFWPSCSADSEYVYKFNDSGFCSKSGILNMYEDWKDVSKWPQVPGHEIDQKRAVARQQDPETKPGVIGAFCRSYGIAEAIESFIPKAYEPVGEGRYTYLGGSTSGGAVVYDNKFLYSHHATDPASATLVNAFDLVRLHLFGDLDDEAKEGTPQGRLPSYMEMKKVAVADKTVAALMNKERHDNAVKAFETPGAQMRILGDPEDDEVDTSWIEKLSLNDSTGNIDRTINNIVIILENDPGTKGKIALDEFASRGLVLGSLPWNANKEKRNWDEIDDAELARFLETGYQITGQDKIEKALTIVSARNKINDVKRYLEGLKWDGIKRVDTLLIDYLGAEDNIYTREVMRKTLVAAVARAILADGKVKFDTMPILVGSQGLGKSTFLDMLGREWFSDSLQVFEGKEAAELIQGTWINEIGELAGLRKSEVNNIKQFLSKKEDIFRAAYGRRTAKYPRRCIFVGTTNDAHFLKDPTGERRFWPVDCGNHRPSKSIFKDLKNEIDGIWAEAYMYWALGESVILSNAAENLAKVAQEDHRIEDDRKGIIEEFLDTPIPENWYNLAPTLKRAYLSGTANLDGVKLEYRQRISAIEVWTECLGFNKNSINNFESGKINAILETLKGWKRFNSALRVGGKEYGKQRGFERIDLKEMGSNVIDFKTKK